MSKKTIIKQQIAIVDSLSTQVSDLEQKLIALEKKCSANCKVKAVATKAPVKKTEAKKAPVKKTVAKKAPVKAVAKKAPVKKTVATKAPVKKTVATKAPVKTAAPKLSADEIKRRDAKREALKKKAAKVTTEGKKITAADLKKIKLTDLYGVGPKIEEYLIANKIDDMLKLSTKDVTKFTKKFVSDLPALNSFTYEMKYDKLEMIIGEAKFMIKELT